jgi:hypothetical protein
MGVKRDKRDKGDGNAAEGLQCPEYYLFSGAMMSSLLVVVAFGETGAGHPFAQAAFFDKILLQSLELLVEKIGGHFDEAGYHVGADGRVGVFDAFAESFVVRAGVRLRRRSRRA